MGNVILVSGLSVVGTPYSGPIAGTYVLAGINSDGLPSLLALNSDGSLAGGGGGGGSGSVTSIGIIGSGLVRVVSGSPVTGAGNITLSLTASDDAHFARGDGSWSAALNGPITLSTSGAGDVQIQASLISGNKNLKFGGSSATPVNILTTMGESGVGTNIAGGWGVFRSGAGTGNGSPSALTFSTPFTVGSNSTVQSYTEGLRVQAIGSAPGLGFFGHAAAARASSYTLSNPTTLRTIDEDSYTMDQLMHLVGTLITDLQAYGLLQ